MQNSALQVMQQHGKTFALAAKLLSPASRNAAAELYAFARYVDDTIDMQATNMAAKAQLTAIQQDLQNTSTQFSALQKIMQQHAINPKILQAFLQVQHDDEDGRQLASEQDLIEYSYGVAGSIGQMMRPILGAPASAEIYAVSLGIAMQLTNIARDVVEDALRSRIYIPATFFTNQISPQLLLKPSPQQAQQIFIAIQKLLDLADEYYSFAQLGYAHIPLRNRLSIAAAGAMYRGIGSTILARGAAQYWQGRVSLGLWKKSAIGIIAVVKTLSIALLPMRHRPTNTGVAEALKHVLIKPLIQE
jgi:15-cis-phytoene synthase